MASPAFLPVYGIIQGIERGGQCCEQRVSIQTQNGIVNLMVSPETYVIDNVRLRIGMSVVGFYDANAPVPLIFPPQFRAVVIGRQPSRENITFDYFNRNLVSSNNSLKLNPSLSNQILTFNGQSFQCRLGNQNLIVYYTNTTRSIPPQTTPSRIIVLC